MCSESSGGHTASGIFPLSTENALRICAIIQNFVFSAIYPMQTGFFDIQWNQCRRAIGAWHCAVCDRLRHGCECTSSRRARESLSRLDGDTASPRPFLYQLLKSNPAERRELRPMCEAQMLLAKPNEVGLRGKGRIISPVDAVPLAAQHDLAMLF